MLESHQRTWCTLGVTVVPSSLFAKSVCGFADWTNCQLHMFWVTLSSLSSAPKCLQPDQASVRVIASPNFYRMVVVMCEVALSEGNTSIIESGLDDPVWQFCQCKWRQRNKEDFLHMAVPVVLIEVALPASFLLHSRLPNMYKTWAGIPGSL